MDKFPPAIRAKYDQLTSIVDSRTSKPVSQSLGGLYGFGLYDETCTAHPAGGQLYHFYSGYLSSYDHTGRFPVVAIYGEISHFYKKLGAHTSPLGRPLTDVQDLPDGSRCVQFEGGHVHEIDGITKPFLPSDCTAPYQPRVPPIPFGKAPANMPANFHTKWVELSLQRDPLFSFAGGMIVSINHTSKPCVVYGNIYSFWTNLGQVERSGWGRPLSDEQDTEDGGRCSVFEGGHIHRYGSVVCPVAAELCPARYKPVPRSLKWSKMPPHFQRKWTQLAHLTHPSTGMSLAQVMGKVCETVKNDTGDLSGHHRPAPPLDLTPPFVVIGGILSFWQLAGGFSSTYGRPLCDEQITAEGERCSIFEGGHIHCNDEGLAEDSPSEECTAPYQPDVQPAAQGSNAEPLPQPPAARSNHHPQPMAVPLPPGVPATAVAVDFNYTRVPAAQAAEENGSDDAGQSALKVQAQSPPVPATESSSVSVSQKYPDPTISPATPESNQSEALETSLVVSSFTAAELVLSIVNSAQVAKSNADGFALLAKDACEVVYVVAHIQKMSQDSGRQLPLDLYANLERLVQTLVKIDEFGNRHGKQNPFRRIMMSSKDAQKLQEYRDRLNQCLSMFQTQSSIHIRQDLAEITKQQGVLLNMLNSGNTSADTQG